MIKSLYLFFGLLMVSVPSFSQFMNETRLQLEPNQTGTVSDPLGLWFFIGGNTGWVSRDTNIQTESFADGFHFNIEGTGSYYTDNRLWIIDAGLGLHINRLSSNNNSLSPDGFFLELAPKYRAYSQWQVGPVLNLSFGDGAAFQDSENGSSLALAGLGLTYELPLQNKWPLRIGGKLLTDITISDRTVTMALFSLAIGLPSNSYSQNYVQKIEPQLEVEKKPSGEYAERVQLNQYELAYDLGKVQPNHQVQSFLSILAEEISNTPELTDTIVITGRTDSLGKEQTNKILSKARAQSVIKIMNQRGVSMNQLVGVGVESQKSFVSDPADRRIDIEFLNVSDKVALEKAIEKAAQQAQLSKKR